MITYQVRLVFKVLHTFQEKSPQNPTTKTATSSQDLTSIPQGYRKMKILPVFVKVKTKWNFTNINQGYRFSAFSQQDENTNIMHQGNSFSALSPQEKISILCTKGTASQLFPHKRKYQYYAPREQLLSFFPTKTRYFNYNTAFYWSRRGHQLIL